MQFLMNCYFYSQNGENEFGVRSVLILGSKESVYLTKEEGRSNSVEEENGVFHNPKREGMGSGV